MPSIAGDFVDGIFRIHERVHVETAFDVNGIISGLGIKFSFVAKLISMNFTRVMKKMELATLVSKVEMEEIFLITSYCGL